MRLRRTWTALVVGLMLTSATVAVADVPAEQVYLSLGTSLAAGSQIDPGGNTTSGSDESYTDQLYQRVAGRLAPNLVHEKLGCAGETADTIRGGVNVFGQPSTCTYPEGSQLDAAFSVISEGTVALITIDLGANDVIQAQQVCGGEASCIIGQLPGIAAKVGEIVGELRAAGYDGPILAMNYYNPQVASAVGFFPSIPGQHDPDPALAIGSDQLTKGFNALLAYYLALEDAEVVDVYSAFNAGDFGDDQPLNGVWDNVDAVCALSYMCPTDPAVKANIHLNRKGYKVTAKTFLGVLEELGIIA